jgi:hypothetical protein
LLVYINGNNSLDSFGAVNLKEMEKVGSTDKINVVAQWASYSDRSTKRLLIQKSTDPSNVTSPVLQNLGIVDMGDYNSITDFVKWGVANFPADHYFIDVWDHGGGWHLSSMIKLFNQFAPTDISEDENSGHIITTPQLGMAIAASAQIIGHKVDLYASDACLMAMPEISHEMADSVQIYAGSEETEPGAGWPYDALLTDWNAAQDTSAANVAKILTRDYVKSYQNGSHGTGEVTFSAFDLSHSSEFISSITALGKTLGAASNEDKPKVVASISATQSFEYSDYGDLGDFLKNLSSSQLKSVPSEALAATNRALSTYVIANASTPGSYARATGLSIWLPSTADTMNGYWPRYQELKFEKATQWGEGLKGLLNP